MILGFPDHQIKHPAGGVKLCTKEDDIPQLLRTSQALDLENAIYPAPRGHNKRDRAARSGGDEDESADEGGGEQEHQQQRVRRRRKQQVQEYGPNDDGKHYGDDAGAGDEYDDDDENEDEDEDEDDVEEEEAEEDFGKEALKTWHERWFEEYAGPVEAKENETGCCIRTAEEEVLRQRAENEGEGAEVKDVAVHNKIVAIKDVFVSNEGCSWEHSVVLRVSYTGGGEIWEEVS